MKKIILVLGLLIIAAAGVSAQKTKVDAATSASAASKASASTKNGSATLASGTQIAGQLQGTLDAKNARVGDQVVLKTTQAVKQNGQVVVQKGSKLIGHVTEVQQKAKDNATSKIGVVFDTLQQGGSRLPINAVITSVMQAAASANISGDDDMMGSGMSTTSASTASRSSSSGSSGGLLGGVGNTVGGVTNGAVSTVGGVANTAGQTVGGVTSTAGQTLGSTTQSVGGTLRGLQITQSTDASANGGSTLSLTGGNVKLDKGATVNLSVSQSSSVKTN